MPDLRAQRSHRPSVLVRDRVLVLAWQAMHRPRSSTRTQAMAIARHVTVSRETAHGGPRMDTEEPVEDMVSAMLEGAGYRELTIELMPGRGEFVATAIKRIGVTPYRAQAIGRTKKDAAHALVKTISRPSSRRDRNE